MDSTYAPQSPDLSSYAPQSPDLSGLRPQSPDLSGLGPPPFGRSPGIISPQQHRAPQQHYAQFGSNVNSFHNTHNGFTGGRVAQSPTSVPLQPHYQQQQHPQYQQQGYPPVSYQQTYLDMPPTTRRALKAEEQQSSVNGGGISNGIPYYPQQPQQFQQQSQYQPPHIQQPTQQIPQQNFYQPPPPQQQQQQHFASQPSQPPPPPADPTLGVHLKTSFPVARIKRIMQNDEDIGKVAQVTPHVVSRALELFMIQMIAASADQARGASAASLGQESKGPKRILAQHLKRAIKNNDRFDFLTEIADKVPDAPAKSTKKEQGKDSDSEDAKPRKGGKKRKDSGDDF